MVDAKRVCVCDDEAAIADLVGQLLRENGFRYVATYRHHKAEFKRLG